MIKEEAKEIIESECYVFNPLNLDMTTRINTALDVAVEALEQEPCEDAVSRAEVIDELNRIGRNAFKEDTDYDNFFAFLDGLPSVTPTRPKGYWIDIDETHSECDQCGAVFEIVSANGEANYCPNCGCLMSNE